MTQAEGLLQQAFTDTAQAGELLERLYSDRPPGFEPLIKDCAFGAGRVDGCVIKRADKETREQALQDARITTLNIAPLLLTASSDKHHYLVTEYIQGPDLAQTLARSAEADREELLSKNLEDLVTWQRDYPPLNEEYDPDEVHSYYQNNIARIDPDPVFRAATGVFELWDIRPAALVRTRDNSPHNSGFSYDGPDLLECLDEVYYHWDMAHKASHELEDFLAIYDSYEADQPPLQPDQHSSLLEQYERARGYRFGRLDLVLMGLYRNLRKSFLLETVYPRLIEEETEQGGLSSYKRGAILEEYEDKSRHYRERAAHYARTGFGMFVSQSPYRQWLDFTLDPPLPLVRDSQAARFLYLYRYAKP